MRRHPLLKRAGTTFEELAKKTGICSRSLRGYLTEGRKCPTDRAFIIAEALGMSVEELRAALSQSVEFSLPHLVLLLAAEKGMNPLALVVEEEQAASQLPAAESRRVLLDLLDKAG